MAPEKDSRGQEKRSLPSDPARGELVRRKMDEHGWTIKALAEDLEIHTSSIDKWRAGKPMRRSIVPRLAGALQIDSADLIGPHGNSPPTAEERIVQAFERRGGMRDFDELAGRIADLRGDDPDGTATLSSLRADVQALTKAVLDLLSELQELDVLGEGAEGVDRNGASEEADPESGTS